MHPPRRILGGRIGRAASSLESGPPCLEGMGGLRNLRGRGEMYLPPQKNLGGWNWEGSFLSGNRPLLLRRNGRG